MGISLKKTVLVSLLVIVGLPFLLVLLVAGTMAYDGWRMSKGEYPLADSSEAKIGQFVLRLDRYAIHPFLAEYKRVLVITDADGVSHSRDLSPDTGGGGLITICETENGDLRLADRFETNIVDTDGRLWTSADRERNTVEPALILDAGQTVQADCKRSLGRFDKDGAKKYGFQTDERI